MTTYNVDDEASFLTIAADLEKSLDPYDRASGRAVRALLPAVIKHCKSEGLNHWQTADGFSISTMAIARALGIALYLVGVSGGRGDRMRIHRLTEACIRDAARSAVEQLQQPPVLVKRVPIPPNAH